MKRTAASMNKQMGQNRLAVVKSVDPNTYTAKVALQPDGTLTGWLPITTEWVGNGWGLICPPNIGDQVTVVPHDGDANNLIISGRVFSQVQPPPAGVSGEMWLVHVTGASIKLVTSGAIVMNAPAGVQITGNVTVTGSITSTGDMVAGGGGRNISLLNHEHTSESPGTPTSAPITGT
jgi:phage baseplate assembly protein gpV